MLRRVLVLTALLTALLAVSACSGASESEQPSDYDATVVRDGLGALFAGDHAAKGDTEVGTCFAEAFTDSTTPEELRDAGVLDDQFDVVAELPPLSPEVAAKWVDAQFACTDFVEESTRAQEKVTKGRLDSAAYAACLREALTDDQVRDGMVDALTGDWQGTGLAALGRAQTDCASEATPDDAD